MNNTRGCFKMQAHAQAALDFKRFCRRCVTYIGHNHLPKNFATFCLVTQNIINKIRNNS